MKHVGLMTVSLSAFYIHHIVKALKIRGLKATKEDIAQVVMDLLRHPRRSLPSKIEIRPAKTA